MEQLTDTQRRQIRELRMRGLGYKAIGEITGLGRGSVREFCKRNNLLGYGKALRQSIMEKIQEGSLCPQCGAPILQPVMGRRKRFCSDTCRQAWWAAHQEAIQHNSQKMETRVCAYCGTEFRIYSCRKQKYCCHDCYVHDRFWRKEEGREPYRKEQPNDKSNITDGVENAPHRQPEASCV